MRTCYEPAAEKARYERLERVPLGRVVLVVLSSAHAQHDADQVLEHGEGACKKLASR